VANKNILNLNTKDLSTSFEGSSNALPAAIKQTVLKSVEDINHEESTIPLAVKQLQVDPTQTSVPAFGNYTNPIQAYPNDVVRLDIVNANNQYLESNFRVTTFNKNGDEITLDPEKDLADLGYISGKYRILYKFHRNYLGAGDAHKLQVQEVSSDGLEIRVIPSLSTNLDNTNFLEQFSRKFFELPKAQVLPQLFLSKDANTSMQVFDYVQDKFTYSASPYSIIFKLNTPAPNGVVVGDSLWLSQVVSEDLPADTITIVPPKPKTNKTYIAGPNWDAVNRDQTATSTQYKDWDDLLTTNTTTAQDIVNKLISGSNIEGIALNLDYRKFENHIQFGSATERLLNFKYKMQLLESYDERLAFLNTNLTVTGSGYHQNNIADTEAKKAALLGAFDNYEKYLYYQSSSYVSNSYGEFYPSTWPKQNSSKPYVNYSVTSSQVEIWFEGIYASASLYDQNNSNALYKLIPAHILEDTSNEEYVLFTHMIGHYFDLVFAYVKEMTKVYNRDQSILEGFSKELVYHVAKNLGVDFENGNTLEELWSYTLGTDVSGSQSSAYGISTEDKTKETWKRIINNLPYLLKTKGTERGVRALINCFGIPQTILRIREYGGAEPEFDTKTDWVYERFNYSTTVGYNGKTSGNVFNTIRIPWKTNPFTTTYPQTVEMRVKMATNQTKTQKLAEKSGSWYVQASKSGNSQYLTLFLGNNGGTTSSYIASTAWTSASVSCSIYDGDWHHIAIRREVESDNDPTNQVYTLVVKKANNQKIVFSQSASISINGATSQSYNQAWTYYTSTFGAVNNYMYIPATGSYTAAQSHSAALWTGSIQEVRFWTTPLQDGILDNHTLAPTSFQGNTVDVYTGSTSSFDTLYYRLPLGSDNNKLTPLTGSDLLYVSSSHPNQAIQYSSSLGETAFLNFSGSTLTAIYKPETEIHSLEWPDLGTNRQIGNKIRIDETILVSDQLYKDNRVERALTDNFPIDTPRLGVYLSPTNEVNQDIAEQFGGISIDDYIGDPSQLSAESYNDLINLNRAYTKKYVKINKTQNYIRLLRHYDAALFQLVKKFIPHRANAQVGLVIEPHILSRSKVPTKLPTIEEETYETTLDVGPETYITPGGFVQDGDGEPFRNMEGYVQEGTVGGDESDFLVVQGEAPAILEGPAYTPGIDGVIPEMDTTAYDMVVIDGTQIVSPLKPRGYAEVYLKNVTGQDVAGLQTIQTSETPTGASNTGVTAYGRDVRVQGSQYVFMSSYLSSSGQWTPYTSSRYDYHDPIGVMIYGNTPSDISLRSEQMYDCDIYGGKAFSDHTVFSSTATSTTVTTITSSAAWTENAWLREYGLQPMSLYSSSTALDPVTGSISTGYWTLSGLGALAPGLGFKTVAATAVPVTASIRIPAFFYKADDSVSKDLIYQITISTDEVTSTTNTLELHFGDLDCGLTGSISPTTTQTEVTFTTKALGPWLGLRLYSVGIPANNTAFIPTLKVRCLNYHAEVQDFHLRHSYGMRTVRYDGSKLTSTDWNVNSPDTIDGGPVVQVTVGGGKQLGVKPSTKGTFEIK
jgi:hypothetical protein